MKQAVTITDFIELFPYGVTELRRSYKKFFIKALLISVSIHLAGLGGYFLGRFLAREKDTGERVVRIVKYAELGPPPSMQDQAAPPALAVSVPVSRPTIGMPVPVKDAEISQEVTIATQQEIAQSAPSDTGGAVAVTAPASDESAGAPAFESYELDKPPAVSERVQPEYPYTAREKSIEGAVQVKILVLQDGSVGRVLILDARPKGIFEEAVNRAVARWRFTPGTIRGKVVTSWVVTTIHFDLKN